jgi:hypothetical protein
MLQGKWGYCKSNTSQRRRASAEQLPPDLPVLPETAMTRQQQQVLWAARDWYAAVAHVGSVVSVDRNSFVTDDNGYARAERAALRRLWDATEELVGMKEASRETSTDQTRT